MSEKSAYKNFNSDDFNNLAMSFHKAKHSLLDAHLREKCISLNNRNITAEHFGGQKSYAIKLTSPVVELSVLDMYDTPDAKLNCLCTTYDLIFAELKSAMVYAISTHSDKDIDIPIVDNEDILPILMSVIVKSKLPYLWSNLKFMEFFYKENLTDFTIDASRVLKLFHEAVRKLLHYSEDSINPNLEEDFHSLTLHDFVNLSQKLDRVSGAEESNKGDLIQEQTDRIVDLITTCTTSDDPV